MDYEQFVASLDSPNAPAGLSPELLALWYDGREDWEHSHHIAQDIDTNNGSWIHAYLHRKEGDLGNARYWYHRAGRNEPSVTLKEEWATLVKAFL